MKCLLIWRELILLLRPSSVSREEIAFTSRNIRLSEQLGFSLDEMGKSLPEFNASGRSLLIKFHFACDEKTQ